MRYELDENGYICKVFFGCLSGTCTKYEGEVPAGYTTLEEWVQNANIRAYKIVDGNLTHDAERDAQLLIEWQTEWEKYRPPTIEELDLKLDETNAATQEKIDLLEEEVVGNYVTKDEAQIIEEKANDAKSAAETAQTAANTAQTTAENANTTASQAQTTANSANTTANEAKENAETAISKAETAQSTADTANANANTAIADAKLAVEDAEKANTAAGEAKENAATAITKAETAQSTAEGADTKATEAKNEAEQANTKAGNAETVASNAQSKAEDAEALATTANNTATTAQTTANNAATAASNAQTAADNAQATANSANTTATNAQTTANNANATAENAQATANSANATATAAQNTANTANENATKAQNTADSATTTAQNADAKAEEAKTNAQTATQNAQSATELATTANNNANTATQTANDASEQARLAVEGAEKADKKVDTLEENIASTYTTKEETEAISNSTTQYAAWLSDTAVPRDSQWQNTCPSTSIANPYIWTRELITWADGTTSTTEPKYNSALTKNIEETNAAAKEAAQSLTVANEATAAATTANNTANQAITDAAAAQNTANLAVETAESKVGKNEIIAEINKSDEQIQIQADKVSLYGKTLNLTGEEIEIKSNNFNVDKNGNTDLNDAKLTFNIRPPRDFTPEDIIKIGAIYNGERTPTAEEIELYDLNKNGVIDEEDWAEINFWYYYANCTTTEPGKLEINGGDATDLITIRDKDGDYKVRIGVDGIYTKNLIVAGQSKTLFEDDEGDYQSVTLSDSAANYSYMEIYYKNDDGQYGYQKVYEPNGKTTFGTVIRKNSGDTNIMINSALFNISEEVITITRNSQANVYFGSKNNSDNNKIYITKVVGYK